jgi:hypothetical protein
MPMMGDGELAGMDTSYTSTAIGSLALLAVGF